jgi:Flp pilus assembly protein TadD
LRVRALKAFFALQQAHPMDNPLIALPGIESTATALGLVARTLRLLLYPLGLSADYSGPVIRIETGLFGSLPLIGSLVLLGCAALALRPAVSGLRSDGTARRAALGSLLFLLPYLVIGNLLFGVGTIFAERLLYFPSVGFCFLCGMLLLAAAVGRQRQPAAPASPARYPPRLVLVALGAWLAAFTVLTWARSLDWRNDETLFRAASVSRPQSPRAHYIVGKLLADRGEFAAALERYDRTTDLYPAHASAWNEKGVVHGRLQQFEEAERMFREAIRISPSHSDAHLNLGIALRRQGRLEAAEKSLRRALLWDATSSTAWAELGNLYLSARRYAAAEEAYRRGVALGRRDLAQRVLEAREAARRAE